MNLSGSGSDTDRESKAAHQAGLVEGHVSLDAPLELAHVLGELHSHATDALKVRGVSLHCKRALVQSKETKRGHARPRAVLQPRSHLAKPGLHPLHVRGNVCMNAWRSLDPS